MKTVFFTWIALGTLLLVFKWNAHPFIKGEIIHVVAYNHCLAYEEYNKVWLHLKSGEVVDRVK